MIHNVKITPLRIIPDNRGKVMHMLRSDSEVFSRFGEIYFSTVFYKSIKAWHLHKESTLNYVCVSGEVKLVLFDDRENSPTKNQHQELKYSVSFKSPQIQCTIHGKNIYKALHNFPLYKRLTPGKKYGKVEEIHTVMEQLRYDEFGGVSDVEIQYKGKMTIFKP